MALDSVLIGLLDDALLAGEGRREMLARLMPTLVKAKLRNLLRAVSRVYAATPLIDYCYDSIAFTRRPPHISQGFHPGPGWHFSGRPAPGPCWWGGTLSIPRMTRRCWGPAWGIVWTS